jgi:hypothetical protein
MMEERIKTYCVPAEHCFGELLTSDSDRLCTLGIPCLCFSLAMQVATHSLLPVCLLVLHYRKCYSVKGHGHSSTLPSHIVTKIKYTNVEGNAIVLCFKNS